MEILRPGYKPLSEKDIGVGKLLDAAVQQIDVQLEKKSVKLQFNTNVGWIFYSSVKNDPIQPITIHTGTESYQLKV